MESQYHNELINIHNDNTLHGFKRERVFGFLHRHTRLLRSLRFRNILIPSDFMDWMNKRPFQGSLDPGRACFAEMSLSEFNVLVDVYRVSDELSEDLLWRQQAIKGFAHSLSLTMEPAGKDMRCG